MSDKSFDTDTLVPDPKVAAEFSVSLMTIWRWSHDPALGFPTAVKVRNRNFRSRHEIEEFKSRLMREAISRRAPKADEA